MADQPPRDPLTDKVIGLAIEVHRALGPGLLENAYEACLAFELKSAGIPYKQQAPLPVVYKGNRLDCGYRLDLLVDDRLVVEVKAVERLIALHDAQLLTYMKLVGADTGLLLNFNSRVLKDGTRRLVL